QVRRRLALSLATGLPLLKGKPRHAETASRPTSAPDPAFDRPAVPDTGTVVTHGYDGGGIHPPPRSFGWGSLNSAVTVVYDPSCTIMAASAHHSTAAPGRP